MSSSVAPSPPTITRNNALAADPSSLRTRNASPTANAPFVVIALPPPTSSAVSTVEESTEPVCTSNIDALAPLATSVALSPSARTTPAPAVTLIAALPTRTKSITPSIALIAEISISSISLPVAFSKSATWSTPAVTESSSDAVVIAVSHSEYINFSEDKWQRILRPKGVLIDIKSIFNENYFSKLNFKYWAL